MRRGLFHFLRGQSLRCVGSHRANWTPLLLRVGATAALPASRLLASGPAPARFFCDGLGRSLPAWRRLTTSNRRTHRLGWLLLVNGGLR